MSNYTISKFYSFSDFKQKVGSNNHLLITCLIGIHKVNDEDRKLEKVNHPYSWNPKDISVSIYRSDELVRKACLVWTVDCLDSLMTDFINDFYGDNQAEFDGLIRQNKFYDTQRIYTFDDIRKSVSLKFLVISALLKGEKSLNSFREKHDLRVSNDGQKYFPKIELIVAACDFSIQWRNNLVHSSANNDVLSDSERVLKKYKKILESDIYCSLECERLKKDFSEKITPSFKEIAFMIRSLIDFGFCLNAYWIEKVNQGNILTRVLNKLFKDKKFYSCWNRIKGQCTERKKKYLITTLKQHGIHLKDTEARQTSDLDKILEEFVSDNS